MNWPALLHKGQIHHTRFPVASPYNLETSPQQLNSSLLETR